VHAYIIGLVVFVVIIRPHGSAPLDIKNKFQVHTCKREG
jgi:hypothetical protein